MPIRFRCAYCNQLMAIARRKAGTVVRCPKCAGEIIVPDLDGTPGDDEQSPSNLPVEDKYDAYLDEPANEASGGQTATQTTANPMSESSRDSPIPERSLARRGLFIPLGMIYALIGGLLLLLAVMFALGFFMGRAGGARAEIQKPGDGRSWAFT